MKFYKIINIAIQFQSLTFWYEMETEREDPSLVLTELLNQALNQIMTLIIKSRLDANRWCIHVIEQLNRFRNK